MSSKPNASDFTRTKLPWLAAGALFLIYLVTLNQWISIRSLPIVSKITGWDWTLPSQYPLYYTVAFPFRILPVNIQPVALNVFSAICAGLTIWLLVRSVALLPHDRTDEQRIRQRHTDGLLNTRFAWAPPVLAAAVLGLQLTMWEHATAATNEALDVLIFAYLIRCLLEFRYTKNERWLYKLALVYGLGVTDNWALIGFFPLFLGSLIWMRGRAFFNVRFIGMMTALGLVGMLLYLVLPIVWAIKGDGEMTFWEGLHTMLVTQKNMIFDTPSLRARALILSLTSIVPVIIMAIKFPAGFGDVSGPGSMITSFMFRLVHIVFAVACIWVAFDQAISPRKIGLGLPFLSFYYLGALAAGYYVGYLMFASSEVPKRHWRPPSSMGKLLSGVIHALAWVAVIAVPVALLVKNFKPAYSQNGKLLMQFADALGNKLPKKPAIVLADDPAQIAIMEAWAARKGDQPHIWVNTRSLAYPKYHEHLVKRYGARWPAGGASEDPRIRIDPVTIAMALNSLSTSNIVYYLHPSFGYYFEAFYPEQHGWVAELKHYSTNMIYPPRLSAEQLTENQQFWKEVEGLVNDVESLVPQKLSDISYLANYLSRAANQWGVDLQKANNFADAQKSFERAVDLNTNNIPARLNLDFNLVHTGKAEKPQSQNADLFGQYRSWDQILSDNGPFDEPQLLYGQAHTFMQQYLLRQACDLFKRSSELAPTNATPKISLASALIRGKWLDEADKVITALNRATNQTTLSQKMDLIAMEAAIHFGRQDTNRAEQTLRAAMEKYPRAFSFYDSLNELYRASGQWNKALELMNREVSMMPTNVSLRMQRADVALAAGDTNTAIADLNEVLRIDPNNVDASLFQAFVVIQQKDHAKALKIVDGLLERNEKNVQALTYKGAILMEMNQDEKAIEAFNKALKLDPNNGAAIQNRAILNLRAGHLDAAKEDYERLSSASPKSHQFLYGLAEIAYKKKDNDEAIRNYELYLKYAPTNVVGDAAAERKTVETRLKELKSK
jgi:tetratricopeptide (TPR) repeat protein